MVGNENIGKMDYDLIIANGAHSTAVNAIVFAEAQTLTKGTVLSYDETNGWVAASSDLADAHYRAILANDIEDDTYALAYVSGDFITSALLNSDGTAFDLTDAIKADLQDAGIYVENAED